jgi:hypothetical protein
VDVKDTGIQVEIKGFGVITAPKVKELEESEMRDDESEI